MLLQYLEQRTKTYPAFLFRQAGMSAVAGGAGAELVIVPTDTGALAGWSVSAAAGRVATEAHLTMTYSRVYYLGSY